MGVKISSLIDIADNIEIEVFKSDNSSISMKSNIYNIINDEYLEILSPIHEGKIYPLSPGNKIKIIFNKKDTGIYYFIGEIINRKKINKLSILRIKKTSNIKRSQRRNYFRLDIVLNIEVIIIENGGELKTISVISKDISGGGIRVISKEKLNIDTIVKCNIPIAQNIIQAIGRVVRCELSSDSISKYDIGIEFTDIDESIRTQIISFIFEKQRKLIKRGLI